MAILRPGGEVCVMAETDANERLAFVEVGEMAQPLGHRPHYAYCL